MTAIGRPEAGQPIRVVRCCAGVAVVEENVALDGGDEDRTGGLQLGPVPTGEVAENKNNCFQKYLKKICMEKSAMKQEMIKFLGNFSFGNDVEKFLKVQVRVKCAD